MLLLFFVPVLFILPQSLIHAMRVDPARIAARLRIEQGGGLYDRDQEQIGALRGRNRRQLIGGGGSPKEETIQVTAPLFSSRLFEYGPKAGDKELAGGLDMAKRVHLSRPLQFFGHAHSTIWVLSNGAVAFDHGAKQYRPSVLPSGSPYAMIAPFWNRNDLRNGGRMYYREVNGGRVLERGQSEIRYQYDREVRVLSALLVTYEKMQPLGTEPLPDENTNTFQLALFVTSNGTFANFIYNNIGWTQGAEAGFNAGDGVRHFALPTSGTGNIMYLEDYGNTGIPGEWMFVLEEDRVTRCKAGIKGDTCDEACSTGEWGPDCAKCCHCAQGTCNEVNGECKSGGCTQCWRGRDCQQREPECGLRGAPKCGQNAMAMPAVAAEAETEEKCGEPRAGGGACQCAAGYAGDPYTECTDIDECAQKDTCHVNAICTNTPGRFFCQCREGYSGDGIADCVSAFLYPFDQSHRLPSDTRQGRVEWKLKHPLRVFGRERDAVVISTQGGLILIRGARNLAKMMGGGEKQPRLEELDVQGIAPFFAPMDLARRGRVYVEETTDPTVLGKASKLINDQMGEKGEGGTFEGTHALMVTYENVVGQKSGGNKDKAPETKHPSNTFQTLLIGGRDKQKRENMTFVQFLYRDIAWSDEAEAGIMAPDKSNSILLPGSGTVGIEQLSQLSNVRSQGIWLFRVDLPSLAPCMQPDLQPPYCDARSPTLVNRAPPIHFASTVPVRSSSATTTTTPTTTTTSTTTKKTTTMTEMSREKEEDEEEAVKPESGPVHNNNKVVAHGKAPPELPRVEQTGWQPVEDEEVATEGEDMEEGEEGPEEHPQNVPKSQNPKMAKVVEPVMTTSSTSRKPAIVTIQSKEIEEMPPDAFDDGIIVKMTTEKVGEMSRDRGRIEVSGGVIVPELVMSTGGGLRGGQEAGAGTGSGRKQPASFVQEKEQQEMNHVVPQTELRIAPVVAVPTTTTTTMSTTATTTKGTTTTTEESGKVPEGAPEGTESEEADEGTETEAPPPRQRPTTEAATEKTTTTTATRTTSATKATKQTPEGKKMKTTTEGPPKKVKTESPDGAEEPVLMDFDNNNQLLDSPAGQPNKLSVVVPVAIVLVWLLVLVIVAVFLCCRRRQTQERLRTLYGPAYQIRPVYTMRVNKLGSAYGDAPYGDDPLEKAAQRLSADMTYGTNGGFVPGRYSLYGSSYWNISPADSAASRGRSGGDGARRNGGQSGAGPRGAAPQQPIGEINSPRGSSDSGGTGGGGGADREGATQHNSEQYFASSQRSTARFSSSNGAGGPGRH